MGAPRKQRRKYRKPKHPWEASRIEEEKKLIEEYGLVNKKEIWKTRSLLEKYKNQVKRITALRTEQAKKEEQQLLKKLKKLNLLKEGKREQVLELGIKDLMERRLQTQVLRKGLAKTIIQARQFITHSHITINGKKVNIPSYLVNETEENQIGFYSSSKLANINHPERIKEEKVVKPEEKE